ncbi:hypothetical protein [Actinoallomurus sp. CA-142502]|uniref:hypothetical protein n=1 Tax=Actinoallomurus sp. CA-142502 TaxID=3239885 RepID=UPI003D8B7AFD
MNRLNRLRLLAATAAGHAVRAAPGIGGLALVSYGAWLAYHPAGFIIAGGGLLADRVADARRTARPREQS